MKLSCKLTVILALPVGSVVGQEQRLDVNDVSFLWPPPKDRDEMEALISASDKLDDADETIWPLQAFQNVIATAPTVTVMNSAGRENQITFDRFESEFKDPKSWKVAGVRIDPSAQVPRQW